MKKFNLLFTTSIILLAAFDSCTNPDESLERGLKGQQDGGLQVVYTSDSTNRLVMIYDYDAEDAKLHYRPVEIENQSGDYLKDALQAFIDHNHFLEPTDRIQLDKIERKGEETVLYFSGLKSSKSQKEKTEFFIKALELTIARNFQGKEFQIVLNEEFP